MIFVHPLLAARVWSLARVLAGAVLLVAAPALLAQNAQSTAAQKKAKAVKTAKSSQSLKAAKAEKTRKQGKPAQSKKALKRDKAARTAQVVNTPQAAKSARAVKPVRHTAGKNTDGQAETRLLEVYRLVSIGQARAALDKAQSLVNDYPNFQLAQLVYGDLLMKRVKAVKTLGDVPPDLALLRSSNLQELRAESRLRTSAVLQRPLAGTMPAQFLSLSPRNKHAIAVDVSKARLYLFENTGNGLKLLGDYYISVGKAGTGKLIEGDQRTPLGVYFVTSNLDPNILKDLYGTGALPVNYPNALDVRRGKTGGGIWLHGTPSDQFTRAPLATDGCVAIANPDLDRIIRTVEIRTTPVLIAQTLNWVLPPSLQTDRLAFAGVLQAWARAKSEADPALITRFYAADFSADEKTLAAFAERQRPTPKRDAARAVQLSDVSFMRWTDEAEFMIATFGEVIAGVKGGKTIRQYWQRRSGQWQIIYEAVVG